MTTKKQIRARISKRAAKTGTKAKTALGQHEAIIQYFAARPLEDRAPKCLWRHLSQSEYRANKTFAAQRIVRLGALDSSYSSRRTYTHWTYSPTVGSLALAQGPRLEYTFDGVVKHIPAPRGWAWKYDANGVYIYFCKKPALSYHPDSDDLNRTKPAQIAQKCRRLYAERQAQERKNRAEAAQIKKLVRYAKSTNCMVRLQDSIAAGNCAAGTLAWAERHGIKGNCAAITRLASICDTSEDGKRLALVLVSAARRHRDDMRRGFCQL